MIGSCVSHYRIVGKLGAGGMGEVFAAEDTHLRRRVAIKFPSGEEYDGERRARFLAEARAASRLDHPNIARIYDYGEGPDGRPFLVMELVEGTTLRETLRDGPLPPARSVQIVESILLALGEAHRNGLAHRDIKPGNVMLTETGAVKVLDFGLAKEVGTLKSMAATGVATASMGYSVAGVVRGTPEYMSPEQARGGAIDERSDLFSTGVVLYECLTGRRAFTGASGLEVLDRVIHAEPERPSRIAHTPVALDRVTAKALAKIPDERYQTAEQMLADLRSAERAARKRRRAAILLVAAAAAAVLIGAAFIMKTRPYAPSPAALEWYERGAMALRDGTYYRAAKSLEKAVQLDPRYVVARARLAEARNELDDAEGAREEMLRAMPSSWARPPRGEDALYVEAVHDSLAGDYPSAIAVLKGLADRVPERERSAVLVDLGRARERNGEAAKAVEAYREAIRLDRENAAAHSRLAVLLSRQQSPEAAAEYAAADALYQSQGNTEGQVEVAFERGFQASRSLRTLPEARPALERAIQTSRAISTEYQEIAATMQLGVVTVLEGDPARGEEIATQSVARARRAGMAYLESRGLTDLGQAQISKGDYTRAEANLGEALATARRYHYTRAEARALFALANLHQLQGLPEPGLREIEPSLAFYERGGYRGESMLALTIMARIYRDLGREADAIAAFGRILSLAGAAGDLGQMANAESGIGSVLEQQDRFPEALSHYDQYLGYARRLGNRSMQARGMATRALVLAEMGRLAEADQSLAQAGAIIRDIDAGPALNAVLLRSRAMLALIRGANREAAALARKIADDGAVRAPDRAWAGCIAGVALARAGSAAAGKPLCASAVAASSAAHGGVSLLPLEAHMAEILLAAGESAAAAESLRPVLEAYSSKGGEETGWRVWALAVRIYRRNRDAERARDAAARAAEKLAGLRSAWSAPDVSAYLARPDLRALAAEFQK